MADIPVVAGAKIYIGGAAISPPNADVTSSTFTGVTWTEIDGWVSKGTLGDAAEVITTILINRGRAVKQKGSVNAGSMENTFAFIQGDTGQAALKAAFAQKANYPFRILYDDEISSSGSEEKFLGIVTSYNDPGGDANAIRQITATIEVNTNVLFTAAT